jgi:hypothetical protein
VFSIVRLIPPPDDVSPSTVLVCAAALAVITGLTYWLCGSVVHGPLSAAAFATVGGGSAFGVLVVPYVASSNPKIGAPDSLMVGAAVVGAAWSAIFLTTGLLAAGLWWLLRKRHDIWTGVLCGGVTGFASWAPMVNWSPEPDAPSTWYYCLLPALVGGLYGGFGAAVQILAAHRRRRLNHNAGTLEIS